MGYTMSLEFESVAERDAAVACPHDVPYDCEDPYSPPGGSCAFAASGWGHADELHGALMELAEGEESRIALGRLSFVPEAVDEMRAHPLWSRYLRVCDATFDADGGATARTWYDAVACPYADGLSPEETALHAERHADMVACAMGECDDAAQRAAMSVMLDAYLLDDVYGPGAVLRLAEIVRQAQDAGVAAFLLSPPLAQERRPLSTSRP